MQIGIFARTFPRNTVEEVLDAVVAHNITGIQFNTLCVGLTDMPDELDDATVKRIRTAMDKRSLTMMSLSGTYNMIHPDVTERVNGLRRLGVLMEASSALNTGVITLCSGTRNTDSMWRPHPDNHLPEAWADLLPEMAKAAELAEAHNVIIAFEPEVANVVDSAPKARKLIDEIQSPNLKVVFDGANIHHKGQLPNQHATITDGVQLLAGDIAIAHAKDLDRDGEAGHLAAGTGLLDYDHYLNCLKEVGFDGPMILHGLTEEQVPGCLSFLQGKLA